MLRELVERDRDAEREGERERILTLQLIDASSGVCTEYSGKR